MTQRSEMTTYDLLMRILDNTPAELLDELWTNLNMTLDEIAQALLDQHARELAQKQRDLPDLVVNQVRKVHGWENVDAAVVWTAVTETANLIQPERNP